MSPAVMRLYGALLRAYPRAWRDEYADGMAEVFAQRHAERAGRGVFAVVRLWVREMLAAVWIGARARLSGGRVAGGVGPTGWGSWRPELRHALRRLARSPAFTFTTVMTLALAIAANVAVFTLVERVVLRPLPYESPDELLHLDHGLPGLGAARGMGLTEALYVLYGSSRTLESVAAYRTTSQTIATSGDPERVRAAFVTPSLADVLGVRPSRGRWFERGDVEAAASPVVLVSHGFWMRTFGGDPAVMGRTMDIERVTVEIIGVMPEGFDFGEDGIDLWLPNRVDEADPQVGGFNHSGVARMADGATIEAVQTELDRIIATFPAAYPGETADAIVNTGRLVALPKLLKKHVLGGIEDTLFVLLGAVALVLLVACANIANLLLARAEARRRELAVRRALGSGRRGVFACFMAESVVLSTAGGVLGVLLSWAAVRVLATARTVPLPRLGEVRFDATVLAFAAALIVLATFAFALVPLVRRVPELADALRDSGRGASTSRSGMRTRSVLMGAQVAVALVLLVGCGLMVRSLVMLRNMDPGFDEESAFTFRIGLPSSVYGSDARARAAAAHREILDRLSAIPGVEAAAMTTCLPLDGFCWGDPVNVRGAILEPGDIPPISTMRRVSPTYFEAMGMRLLAGRSFAPGDGPGVGRSAVVSRKMADLYFPGAEPIGQQLHPHFGQEVEDWYTVVGVVDDVPTNSLMEAEPVPAVYFPLEDGLDAGPPLSGMSFVLRTAVPPATVAGAARAAVRSVDPGLPLAAARTLEAAVAGESARTAFTMTLLILAAGIALALGVVGIWGVIAYVVGQRTGEIGIRLVLGARPIEVAALIVRQAGIATLLGMAAGVLIALGVGRVMESLLFGVEARDPMTYFGVLVLLGGVALLACWVPARRAARLDPASALRT